VTVGDREVHAARLAHRRSAQSPQHAPDDGVELTCTAKIRYNHAPQPANARVEGDRLHVTFAEPQHAITPGQAVVLYDGDVVLGGGWICSAA
jgi:tRNA-specific 2-thiouridylase